MFFWNGSSVISALDAGITEVARVYNAIYQNVSGNKAIRPEHWHGRTQTVVANRLNELEAKLAWAKSITYPAASIESADALEAAVLTTIAA